MAKKRILFHAEASYLSSGFSKYYREIMTRIHATGKYIIAEASNYGDHRDPRSKDLPWLFYGNMPLNDQEAQIYNSNMLNQFGAFRWEQTVLDFKPDIVFSCQDLWMQSVIFNSPLRRFYNIVSMVCIDSEPVREEWLAEIESADHVTGYCDWGLDVVRKYSKTAKTGLATPPGANLDIFKPVQDKKAHKQKSGLGEDTIVFGMVARNQKRKLYPDLFRAFRLALDKMNETDPELADRAVLYVHTSYPDQGHDIPSLIQENRLSRKVIFTYVCHQCKQTFVSYFQDARTFCPKCSQFSAQLPNVGFGVTENVLSDIYNLMDCYIQYATNEGAGMPQIEAAACGVATMATDHTAMGDIVRKLGGVPLKVKEVFKEVETHGYKAVPDNEFLAEEIVKFCKLSESERRRIGSRARIGVIQHFDYQKSAQRLMNYFDSVELDVNRWNEPPRLHTPNLNIQNVRQDQFVDWIICNVLGEPERLNTHFAARLNREFNQGFKSMSGSNYHLSDDSVWGGRTAIQGVSPEGMINDLKNMCEVRNHWEKVRCGLIQIPMPEYIQVARQRVKYE